MPLVDAALLVELLELREEENAAIAILTVDAIDPRRLGRIVRDAAGEVERIVEAKDAGDDGARRLGDQHGPVRLRRGLAAATGSRRSAHRRRPGSSTSPRSSNSPARDGRAVVALETPDDGTLLGINDRAELAEAVHDLQVRVNEAHLLAGVTMDDPSTAYVEPTVELASDVILEPNVILRGRTRVGEGTRIGAGSQIADSTIGRDCRIWASVLESSEVEDDVQIGPFAHLRPGSSIGRGAKLGNYAEVKNSRLEAGVQQHHFSYLGDAHVGARHERRCRHRDRELRRPPQAARRRSARTSSSASTRCSSRRSRSATGRRRAQARS